MKALATFLLLGLAYAFEDNELILRPVHPNLPRNFRNITKTNRPSSFRVEAPEKAFEKVPKIFFDDSNDNELFQGQNSVNNDDVLLGLKFLQAISKLEDHEIKEILAYSFEPKSGYSLGGSKPKEDIHVSLINDTLKIVKQQQEKNQKKLDTI